MPVIYQVIVTAGASAGAVEAFRWIAEQSPDANPSGKKHLLVRLFAVLA